MKTTKRLNKYAKYLRKEQTTCEALLWAQLRNKRFHDLYFRRQHQIDFYIVDFICLRKRVIVECDGGQHNDQADLLYDQNRDKYLQDQNYKILRFWNHEIMSDLDAVLNRIYAVCCQIKW